jgi:hypothetical protein
MITIYTYVSNRPDFIELQMLSFIKNLKESFEFVVFNNARLSGDSHYDEINTVCRRVGATVIDIPRDNELVGRCQKIEHAVQILNPRGLYSIANVAHAYALCWSWENIISKEKGAIAIVDSDVFLIQPVKLTETLYPHAMCNIPDGRTHADGRCFMYMWPTFMLADMSKLPDAPTLNWWCGRIEGVPVDVGGQTYHYFQAHPDLDIFNIRRLNSNYLDTSSCPVDPANYDEFYLKDGIVLHYRSGSDWDQKGGEYHRKKTEWLKKRMEEGV